jgi:hypothetical protein
MPISWNEIRHNAVAFAMEWAGAAREHTNHERAATSSTLAR